MPDKSPETKDQRTRSVRCRQRQYQLSPWAAGEQPQRGKERKQEEPEGHQDRRDSRSGKRERPREANKDKESAERGLEKAVNTKEESDGCRHRLGAPVVKQWCLPEELAPYHRLFYEIYALSLQHPERFPGFLDRGAAPWLPFVRDLALRSGLPETEASLVAWMMTSTVLGALLILLATGDRDGATRAVYAVADQVEAFTSRRPL